MYNDVQRTFPALEDGGFEGRAEEVSKASHSEHTNGMARMGHTSRRESLEDAAFHSDTLHVAFVGLTDGILEELQENGPVRPEQLAGACGLDGAYLERWLEAAHGHELLEYREELVRISDFGRSFLPEASDSLMPLAIQSVLSPRLADRLTELMRSGERPGEGLLEEFEHVIPWFGRMLEGKFRPVFREEVLPASSVYESAARSGGSVLDLGCGNGWYLRELASSYGDLTGVGIDAIEENIDDANKRAEREGRAGRFEFCVADIFGFRPDRRFDVVALNRTLHHVWSRRDELAATVDESLAERGHLVVWEPRWPDDRDALREPRRRGLGMRNLAEHAMGNRLLTVEDVADWMRSLGLTVAVEEIDAVETLYIGEPVA